MYSVFVVGIVLYNDGILMKHISCPLLNIRQNRPYPKGAKSIKGVLWCALQSIKDIDKIEKILKILFEFKKAYLNQFILFLKWLYILMPGNWSWLEKACVLPFNFITQCCKIKLKFFIIRMGATKRMFDCL